MTNAYVYGSPDVFAHERTRNTYVNCPNGGECHADFSNGNQVHRFTGEK